MTFNEIREQVAKAAKSANVQVGQHTSDTNYFLAQIAFALWAQAQLQYLINENLASLVEKGQH